MENGRQRYRNGPGSPAMEMRSRAQSIAEKRKQEYLGARVPRALREKILVRAEMLGIPVSILIRDILTDYIENLGEETDNYGKGAVAGQQTAEDGKQRFSEVIGWEILMLNREVICSGCGRSLAKGEQVTYGIVPGQSHVILCGKCKQEEGLD